MSSSVESLIPQLANDPNVRPPYSNTQISDTAMHHETLYIYYHSRNETRRYYDLGHYTEGENEENWIIKWLLWHVFRYRDNRNRGRSMPGWIATYPGDDEMSSPSTSPNDYSTVPPRGDAAGMRDPIIRQGFYDPVRDAQRAN